MNSRLEATLLRDRRRRNRLARRSVRSGLADLGALLLVMAALSAFGIVAAVLAQPLVAP